jgi:hypothetical protein
MERCVQQVAEFGTKEGLLQLVLTKSFREPTYFLMPARRCRKSNKPVRRRTSVGVFKILEVIAQRFPAHGRSRPQRCKPCPRRDRGDGVDAGALNRSRRQIAKNARRESLAFASAFFSLQHSQSLRLFLQLSLRVCGRAHVRVCVGQPLCSPVIVWLVS